MQVLGKEYVSLSGLNDALRLWFKYNYYLLNIIYLFFWLSIVIIVGHFTIVYVIILRVSIRG